MRGFWEILAILHLWSFSLDRDPEVDMTAQQLIESKGYPYESHNVSTIDGYILTMHRIPNKKFEKNSVINSKRPIVLIQHGLLCDSTFYLCNLPNQTLPFMLADAEIDVWIGNNRGNRYSRRHESLSPDTDEFWDWSWDEMALYDLPAMTDYILQTTKNDGKIYYIGHSEGTLIAFAQGSVSSLELKIQRFYALAPVTKLATVRSPIRYFAPHYHEIALLLGRRDFLSDPHHVMSLLAKTLCTFPETSPLCSNILAVLSGHDSANLNKSRIPVYITHTPSATSVKNIQHFAQMIMSKQFQRFDYGSPSKNQVHYNSSIAPIFELANFKVPTVIYAGGEDWLATPTDVASLLDTLGKNCKVVFHNITFYDHLDFVWALDAADLIFKPIIKDILSGR